MTEREPEAWETTAPGPYATMDCKHGTVTIWAGSKPGEHIVRATGRITVEESIQGHDPAHARADELAAMLD